MGKNDTMKIIGTIFVAVLVICVVIFAAMRYTGGQPSASCQYHDAHTLFLSATDQGLQSTAVAFSAKVYEQQSDGTYKAIGTFDNNTAISMSPNVRYQVYATASGYYPEYFAEVTSCGPTTNKVFSMAYEDTALVPTLYDQNGVTLNDNLTGNETIIGGSTVHPVMQLVGGTPYAWATDPQYNHGYIALGWNATEFDKSNLQVSLDGTACAYEKNTRSAVADSVAMKCNGNIYNGERHIMAFSIPARATVGLGSMTISWCPYTTGQNTINDAIIPDTVEDNAGATVGTCQTLGTYYYNQ